MKRISIGWWLALAILSAWIVAPAGPASAAKEVKVKVTVTLWGPRIKMLPAGDNPGHTVGLGRRTGRAVFSDGRRAGYGTVFFVEYFRGQYLRAWGYTKMVFKKGSWIFFKWSSRFVGRDKAGRPVLKGTGKIVRGAGDYKGIKGSVTFVNRQAPPGKDYPKGARQAKAVINYTLP